MSVGDPPDWVRIEAEQQRLYQQLQAARLSQIQNPLVQLQNPFGGIAGSLVGGAALGGGLTGLTAIPYGPLQPNEPDPEPPKPVEPGIVKRTWFYVWRVLAGLAWAGGCTGLALISR